MEYDGAEADSVQVAVHIRPLILQEQLEGCKECISVAANEPQVRLGSHVFTFDRVYGSNAWPPCGIFDECIAPLVDGLFQGYNATVLAYGQTGSGKTYTMGSGGNAEGIIPKAVQALFDRMEQLKDRAAFQLRVSFIEILKEDIHDLLDPTPPAPAPKPEPFAGAFGISRPTSPGKPAIVIRETSNGGITMPGVTEVEVSSLQEMSACLEQGSSSRATGSTNMNSHSSRSHAIFTINMEQHMKSSDEAGGDLLFAKLHLVDLAGSERAKRTGADGMRFKEGVHINRGLLALGNVISALGDDKKRKEGGHIPYRDSKLTRLLQDSLGGNSRTVMIACVSPADANAEETLNTLKYANRARNIKNRATVNRDSTAAELQRLRQQVEVLQNQLLTARAGSSADEFEILKQRVQWLEARNTELRQELGQARNALHALSQEDDSDTNGGEEPTKESRLLETRLKWLRDEDRDGQELLCYKEKGDILASIQEPAEAALSAEVQHAELQDDLDKELEELNMKLAQKEAEMKTFTKSHSATLRQKLVELEDEKSALQRERDVLLAELEKLASATDEQAQKMQQSYLQKLKELEYQIAELKKKQDSQTQLIRQKQRSEEAAKRLQDDIHRIKQQKVQLQQKIKQESEQFRVWKVAREKELLQLRKEGRRNEFEMHKLRALQQHQKMVLQRKTEEAANASRRLKELLESRRSCGREIEGSTDDKVLQDWFEHEVQVALHTQEVRLAYEKQSEARTVLADELARLRREEAFAAPSSRNGRSVSKSAQIYLLESMLNASSDAMVTMASELSEAQEQELNGRWQQVKSMSDAKAMLSLAFGATVCARCELKVQEGENAELRDKLVELTHALKLNETRTSERERHQRLKEQAVAVALVVATKAAADAAVRCGLDELRCCDALNCSMPKAKLQAGKLCKWKQSQRQRCSLHLKWKWQKPWRLSEWGMGKGAAAYRFDVRHRDRWKRIKTQECV